MTMNFQTCMQSQVFRSSVIIVGIASVALVSFAAGVAVGLHKARFSYAWGENYERNFLGGSHGFMPGDMMGKGEGSRGFRNPHGISGIVLSIENDSLFLKNRNNNQESSVRITDQTLLMKQQTKIVVSDIQKNDIVMVDGKPAEDGVVVADFVRVFDQNEKDDERDSRQPMGRNRGK